MLQNYCIFQATEHKASTVLVAINKAPETSNIKLESNTWRNIQSTFNLSAAIEGN